MQSDDQSARAIWDGIFNDRNKADKTGGRYFYHLALQRIRRGQTICDAGSGEASYLPELIKRCGPDGSFIGIDFSNAALAKSAASANGFPNAHFVLADLRRLPLSDQAVDRVLCAETLPYLLGYAEEALKELARIARKEVIFSLHARGAYEIKGAPIEFRGNIVVEHRAGAKPPRIVFNLDEILKLVEAMEGFRITTIRPFRWFNLMDIPPGGDDWSWYLPPKDTIALYYVAATRYGGFR